MTKFNTYNTLADAQDISASFNSAVLALDFITGFSIQAIFTGAPVGEFKLQASNDNLAVPVNWSDVADSNQAITAAGDIMWVYDGAHFKFCRVVYTSTSGTGSCNITAIKKGIANG
jgi:hypothetical protein